MADNELTIKDIVSIHRAMEGVHRALGLVDSSGEVCMESRANVQRAMLRGVTLDTVSADSFYDAVANALLELRSARLTLEKANIFVGKAKK